MTTLPSNKTGRTAVRCLRLAAKHVLTIIACSAVMFALLILTFLVPLNRTNYDRSQEILNSEGLFPNTLERRAGNQDNIHTSEPAIAHSSNDHLSFQRAAGKEGASVLYNAIMMESDFGEYTRYWHGDVVLIRFMLLFFDVKGMRFIGMIVQFILVFMVAILIREKVGNQGAWMFGLSYILMMPETMATCSIFIGFYIILISLILLIRIIDRSGQEFFDTDRFLIFCCVAGALMCYFDRIVICIMGWIIPTFWMLYLCGREEKMPANIRRVISSGVSWLVGFAGCWMCKLIIALVYSGKSIFETAQERAELWTGAEGGKLYGLWLCSKHYLYPVYAILICGFLIYLSIRFITGGLSKNNSTLGMMGVAVIPLAWLIVMSFHAVAHHFFAYRIFGVALSCGMILLLGTTGATNLRQFKSKEGIAPISIRIAICAGIMLVALLITSTVRETEEIQNADIPGYYIYAEDADKVADTVFRPAYSDITRICMGIYTENEYGSVKMELYENGTKIDEKEYPAAAFIDGRWSELDVDWHFKKGSEYMIRLDGENTEGKFGVYVPYEGGRMLDELTGLNLSGRDTGTAPMAWIVYRRGLYKRNLIVYSFMIYELMASVAMTIYSIVKNGNKVTVEQE